MLTITAATVACLTMALIMLIIGLAIRWGACKHSTHSGGW